VSDRGLAVLAKSVVMIKPIIRRLLPKAWHPLHLVRRSIDRRAHGQVVSGPFAGMRYAPEKVVGSVVDPKRLGTYELELWPIIEDIVKGPFDRIVNVGAGEGYYAVGLALRMPAARVVAFEQDPSGRASIKALADQNRVLDRVEVRGRCEPADLSAALSGERACVVCDVEGEEAALLDPAAAPELRRHHVLVEIHDFVVPGVGQVIERCFDASHEVEVVWQRDRRFADFPSPGWLQRLLPERYTLAFLHESRPARMRWLYMIPRRRVLGP
jgi:hypothetical protein